MRLHYKINLVSLGILTAVALAIGVSGVLIIDNLTYDLNTKLLSAELDMVMDDIQEAQDVLEESGVATVAAYIQSAKQDVLEAQNDRRSPRFGHLWIVDLAGNVVRHEDIGQGEPFDLDCLPMMLEQESGMLQCRYGDLDWFHFYRVFPQWNWLVSVSASTDEMFFMRTVFMRSVLAILFISLLVGGTMLVALTRGFVGPVRELATAALRLSKGKFDEPLAEPKHDDEVAELARAFRVMTDNLSAAHMDLERQTEELTEANRNLNLEVAERRKAEEELAALNRNLEDLVQRRTSALVQKAEELEEANRQLKEMDELKSSFLSSVSHELRTPLTSVLGFAKVIYKDFRKHYHPLEKNHPDLAGIGERIARNLDIIDHEGSRLTRMINDLLDLAKIESGRLEWHDQPIHPRELMDRALNSIRPSLQGKPQVSLTVDVDDNAASLLVDPDRIEQVLINLLNNAIKFTDQGCITVRCHSSTEGTFFTVEDSGCGMSQESRSKVFDKFYQVSRIEMRMDKPKGTGLGLAISKQIVEHYQGRIWCESVPGTGSVFHFLIPHNP